MAYTIRVKTTFELEGESDSLELCYPCEYFYSRLQQVIKYDEQTEEGVVPTCITVQPERVDIVRSSPAMPDMYMHKGDRVESVIETPYGDIPMTTETRSVESEMSEEGGSVRLCYTIDIGGNISSNTVSIAIERCGE